MNDVNKKISLIDDQPRCLERTGKLDRDGHPTEQGFDPDRQCQNAATHEIWDNLDGGWVAHCARCTRFYNPDSAEIRELTPERRAMHFWSQSRPGGRLCT